MKHKTSDYKIATLGSHSALQILKGARDEGFKTMIIAKKGHIQPYRSFKVADEIVELESFKELPGLEKKLIDENVILVPHGSFFSAYTDLEALNQSNALYFGNKKILPWEQSRTRQRDWLARAGLTLPRIYDKPEDIDGPSIIKFYGAGGGKGYFLAKTAEEFYEKIKPYKDRKYIIQEYIVGAPLYVHYFYSPLTDELEVMSMDKRYETNVDSIGRISAKDQLDLNIESSYNIMGNLPVVVRESMLPEIFEMGESVVKVSKELEPGGLIGPFCLETIVTPELEFYVFEISARIVAGTNPYINGSPYTDLRYSEPMSTGRRVAREIKQAIETDELEKVLINGSR
ncbi:MAG TPA: formate--phosphoribosylaminoimidazolecarboxamide ligase [Candidatus Saccharimonadales bacterium]|nr:formate--phosphoribosylaminoimidazolecarboxamide ligase [Candidatus Saccharimonadales bacterium]